MQCHLVQVSSLALDDIPTDTGMNITFNMLKVRRKKVAWKAKGGAWESNSELKFTTLQHEESYTFHGQLHNRCDHSQKVETLKW